MPRDTYCNYCRNLYDHKTQVGHKQGCRMKKKKRTQVRRLKNGTTLRVTTYGQPKGRK